VCVQKQLKLSVAHRLILADLARCAECRRSRLNPKLKKFPRFENTPLLALANDAELQAKARTLLSPPSIRFNDVIEDFIAEMLAAQYLQSLCTHR
jgi:hypothetical protein